MNDFTKDELDIIHLDMCKYVAFTNFLNESPSHQELRKKVASMINNYCDHESQELDCDGGISLVCSYCGKTTMDI